MHQLPNYISRYYTLTLSTENSTDGNSTSTFRQHKELVNKWLVKDKWAI